DERVKSGPRNRSTIRRVEVRALDLHPSGRAGSSTRRCSGQRKEDRSAFPDCALEPHASAVGLDDAFDNWEAEPRSAWVDLPLLRVALEEMRKRSRVDPAASVRDQNRTSPSWGFAPIVMLPPRGVNRTALPTRFSSTWTSRS